MPFLTVNGAALSYAEYGAGEPVLMVAGSASPGRVWRTYQVPALTAAGYQVITFDSRGVPPSAAPAAPVSLSDLVADAAALIEALGIAPCRMVGVSMGSIVVQELLLARRELVRQAVLMATRGRTDRLARAVIAADRALLDSGVTVPPQYAAVIRALQSLSPSVLGDEHSVRDWLEIFELSPLDPRAARAHLGTDLIENRLSRYRDIDTPCLVIGFQDDLQVRPGLGLEVARHIPACIYREVPGCGHLGYLEKPAEVNALIVNFFAVAEQNIEVSNDNGHATKPLRAS